jgi:hypothetical protein
MFTLFVLPIILTSIAVSILVRILIRPFLNPYRIRRPYYGPYGYYGYGRGYRRHRFPAGLLSIFALFALDRFFGRRW